MRKLIIYFVILVHCGLLTAYEDGDKVSVGLKNPVTLEFRAPEKLYSAASYVGTMHSIIGTGNVGRVYRIGQHAVKILPAGSLADGDEIHISKLVGDLGIGPKYFGAWVTEKDKKLYVAIEMEELFGNKLSVSVGKGVMDKGCRELNALQHLFRNRKDGGKTYFFDRLFTMLKILADNNISYGDLHYGNIILPESPSWQDIKLIDFDSARLHDSKEKAARATLAAPYVTIWVGMFDGLPTYCADGKGPVAEAALQYICAI